MSLYLKTLECCLFVTLITAGCSVAKKVDDTLPDYRADYKKSTELPSLELPPNFSTTAIEDQLVVPEVPDSTSTNTHDLNVPPTLPNKSRVLQPPETIQIKRDGNTRWLVIQSTPDDLWPKVRNFWLDTGLKLKMEESKIGVMETEWAENRADIPQDGIRKVLGTVFDNVYSASTRDKFRVRLERGEVDGTTELYLTHKGAQEVTQGDQFVWQNRPSDPELEAEMLHRLMVFLGADKKQADTLLTAQSTTTPSPATDKGISTRANLILSAAGQVSLVVKENFASAWQRTGLALDRVGFTIEDQDQKRGVYFIRYLDSETNSQKPGFFGKLFGKGGEIEPNQEYLISLTDENQATRISILNKTGQAAANKVAEKILTLLEEQLK